MPKTVIRNKVPSRPKTTVGDLNKTQFNNVRDRLKKAGVNTTGLLTNKTTVEKLNKIIKSKTK